MHALRTYLSDRAVPQRVVAVDHHQLERRSQSTEAATHDTRTKSAPCGQGERCERVGGVRGIEECVIKSANLGKRETLWRIGGEWLTGGGDWVEGCNDGRKAVYKTQDG